MELLPRTRCFEGLTRFRLLLVSCSLLVLSVGAAISGATAPSAENDFRVTTVFLVRHAEKATSPPEDPPLQEAGSMRSQELAHLLGKAGIKAIYTSQFLRTKQTAEPLAKHLGIASIALPIKMSASNPRAVSQESINEIAERIYQKAGENALIVGHSNTVPEVIRALGGDVVPTIGETEFDDLFVVTLYAKGRARVTNLKYGNPH
jgi:phosphohistidine phosphatase SixA